MNPTTVQSKLLAWYDQSKRILPWRDNPNPYHVWISEIMLQQTRVEAVIPFFERFIHVLPTIQDVAHAEDDLLNKLWEGLGYYSRVRNIKKAAIQIVNEFHGQLPTTPEELETLSGIGPYTAGAIASIAFNHQATAVDGNVLRVFARLTANQNNIKDPKVKKDIRSLVSSLLPKKRVGDFNQALMEIGATICLPNGAPKCEICPLQSMCKAYQKGVTSSIPVKQPKKKRRLEQRTVLVIEHDGLFELKKRPSKGLLAGLYEFPNEIGHLTIKEIQTRFPSAIIQKLPPSKHIFSHIEWNMIGYHVYLPIAPNQDLMVSKEELLSTYSIPTAFKQYKQWVLEKH